MLAQERGPPVKPGALLIREIMARETHDRPTACESRHHQFMDVRATLVAMRFISGAPLVSSGRVGGLCLLSGTIRPMPSVSQESLCKRLVTRGSGLLGRESRVGWRAPAVLRCPLGNEASPAGAPAKPHGADGFCVGRFAARLI